MSGKYLFGTMFNVVHFRNTKRKVKKHKKNSRNISALAIPLLLNFV